MPTTLEATNYLLDNKVIVGPAKAVNAGGVAVSALEMSQNSMRYSWTSEEVDAKLHEIMKSIVNNSLAASQKYGLGFDLIKGGNIAGFEKVADAMIKQGLFQFLRNSANKIALFFIFFSNIKQNISFKLYVY